ncbi:MAG: hypothetical protein ACE5G2_01845, partial [Candidatus Krumholzibacteriia bacterium]
TIRRWIDDGAVWGADLAETETEQLASREIDFGREVRPILASGRGEKPACRAAVCDCLVTGSALPPVAVD